MRSWMGVQFINPPKSDLKNKIKGDYGLDSKKWTRRTFQWSGRRNGGQRRCWGYFTALVAFLFLSKKHGMKKDWRRVGVIRWKPHTRMNLRKGSLKCDKSSSGAIVRCWCDFILVLCNNYMIEYLIQDSYDTMNGKVLWGEFHQVACYFFLAFSRQIGHSHFPLTADVSPTHSKWNHSIGH